MFIQKYKKYSQFYAENFCYVDQCDCTFSELEVPAFEGCREPTLPDKVEIIPMGQTNFTVACSDPTTHFPESYDISTVFTCDSISRQWEPLVTDIPNCYGNAYTTCHVLRCRVLYNIVCLIIMQNREIYKNIS